MEKVTKFLHFWYMQYILHTGLYMLEPWERRMFNGFLVAVFAMASYTTYLFLPGHLAMLNRYMSYLTGSGDLMFPAGAEHKSTGESIITAG